MFALTPCLRRPYATHRFYRKYMELQARIANSCPAVRPPARSASLRERHTTRSVLLCFHLPFVILKKIAFGIFFSFAPCIQNTDHALVAVTAGEACERMLRLKAREVRKRRRPLLKRLLPLLHSALSNHLPLWPICEGMSVAPWFLHESFPSQGQLLS